MTEARLGKRNSLWGPNNANQAHSSPTAWQVELTDPSPIRQPAGRVPSLDRLRVLSPSQGGALRQDLKTESRFSSESSSGLVTAQRTAPVTLAQ